MYYFNNFIMKKILSDFVKLFVYTIVGLFGTIVTLALLIGIAEGDLSQGLFYYFQ